MTRCLSILSFFLTALVAVAAPQKILVLGDSQSEEYAFELPFSAPDSDPAQANIRNWIEILSAERSGEVSFGSYAGSYLSDWDYRDAGYEFNWGVPSFKTSDLHELLNPPDIPTSFDRFLDWYSFPKIEDQVRDDVAWAVIFCGGNDVNGSYDDYYNGTVTDNMLNAIRDNLAEVINFIQATDSTVKIVLVNMPDVGVTPDVIGDHPDVAKRATATGKIGLLNTRIAALAASENVALVDYFTLTRQMDGAGDFYLNGMPFHKAGHAENPPQYLFAKDGFHPSTVAQALVGNLILRAMNTRYGSSFTLLPNREILSDVLGLNPDQPFVDWKLTHSVAGGANDDPDHDGIPLLVEFALGADPALSEPPPWIVSPSSEAGIRMVVSFPRDQSNGYAVTTAEWSTNLAASWQAVPSAWMSEDATRRYVRVPASAGPAAFVRLRCTAAP